MPPNPPDGSEFQIEKSLTSGPRAIIVVQMEDQSRPPFDNAICPLVECRGAKPNRFSAVPACGVFAVHVYLVAHHFC